MKRLNALEGQGCVGTAKAKRIRHSDVDLHLTCFVGTIIKIARLIRRKDVDRWWRNLVVNGKRRKNRFNASGSTQQVTGHRLRRVYDQFFRMLTKAALDGDRFSLVTQWR